MRECMNAWLTGGLAEWLRWTSSASCLVAMHPDEATDAVVDCAVALDLPFAVVPCCVFAAKFPHRRVLATAPAADSTTETTDPDADPKPADTADTTNESADLDTDTADTSASSPSAVSTYEELLDYLQAKHPMIERATLPFLGRNVVLFRTPTTAVPKKGH